MNRFKLWLLITGSITLLAALGGTLVWEEPKKRAQESTEAVGDSSESGAAGGFAGSKTCARCHAGEFSAWQGSHHALAERKLDPELDRAAFEPARKVRHGSIESTVSVQDGRLDVTTLGSGGQSGVFAPERVIGVAPLEQFVVPFPGGRWQVLSLAFDRKRSEWFDVFGAEDRKPHEWGFWANRGLTWNSMCAGCHMTDVAKRYDAAKDTYDTQWVEAGVGCEACHGPRAAHAEEASRDIDAVRRKSSRRAKPTADQWLDTCGACHARRVEITGRYRAHEPFTDHFRPVLPDETPIYHADGQVHDESFEYVSFLLSRMGGSEGVRCGNCHEPHTARPRFEGNALCLQCHKGKIDPGPHSHHDPAAAGGQCVNCHMPLTTYMQRHPRRDHGFTIPDPLLTREWGIPNACNRCHADKSTDWAVDSAEKLFGTRLERPTRERARTIAKARKGSGAAVHDLLQLTITEKSAAWRATATGLASAWAGHSLVRPILSTLLQDREPLVRAAAARALEHAGEEREELRPLLSDSSRLVRVEAAWVLRKSLDLESLAGRELVHHLDVVSDQPQGALQAGILKLDRGDARAAAELIQKALMWDPGSAPFRQALALALEAQGDEPGAIAQLAEAAKLAPTDADYPFALGLAYSAADDAKSAIRALETACELDPRFARAWYNLGLARSRIGLDLPAIDALRRAQSEDPTSPEYPYARGTIHLSRGEKQEAREAAAEALKIDPDFEEAERLLEAAGGE